MPRKLAKKKSTKEDTKPNKLYIRPIKKKTIINKKDVIEKIRLYAVSEKKYKISHLIKLKIGSIAMNIIAREMLSKNLLTLDEYNKYLPKEEDLPPPPEEEEDLPPPPEEEEDLPPPEEKEEEEEEFSNDEIIEIFKKIIIDAVNYTRKNKRDISYEDIIMAANRILYKKN